MSLYAEIQNLVEQIDQLMPYKNNSCNIIADVLESKCVNHLPLIFCSSRGAVAPGARYNLKEQFYDPEKMLYAHLEEILHSVPHSCGAPLTMRPNFGTIVLPAAFGAEYKVFEDVYPWITRSFTQNDLERLENIDPTDSRMVRQCEDYIRYFREMLPEWIHVYQPDTQGPFDIAHLLLGNELLYMLADNPDDVHRLMRIATRGYIEVTRALKRALCEPETSMFHGHALACGIYMRNGGTRVSEDTPTLLSPEMIDEFVLPYDEEALAAFGGGFIHFCGKHEYLLRKFAALRGNHAVNLGNPEKYDFDCVMRILRASNCTYFGHWPKLPGEDARSYVMRMRKSSDDGTRGLLLRLDENLFPEVNAVDMAELWNGGDWHDSDNGGSAQT